MEKTMEIIRGRAKSEAECAAYWAKKAQEEYGKYFMETHPNALYTKLWRQSYTRRDILFEILAEIENVEISEIIMRYPVA